MAEAWPWYVLAGAAAGLAAGLLGVGGGLVVVPVLAWSFARLGFDPGQIMHLALGTSLAVIVPTAVSSLRAHHRRGAVRWDLFRALGPGVAAGALAGAGLAHLFSTQALKVFFGLFELAVAVQMGLDLRPRGGRALPGAPALAAAGGGIGVLSALAGIGGGTLTVPFLAWCRVPVHQAVATSAACGLPIAAAGALGFIATGWARPGLPAWSAGYVHLPALAAVATASVLTAPVGARLAHRLPPRTLRRVFAVVLAVLGARMLV